jgi:hypothetical protein
MRRIGTISLVAVSALALAAGFAQASTPAATDAVQAAREAEPGDEHGGRGRGHDDNFVVVARGGEPEPGDDKGGHGEPEPGDDNGRGRGRGGHGSDDA